ncbi:MAG: DUF4097 domain-containing protein [Butyrivibrio sp.]|nr:DUF4097 domain-containing protein [Butyrivibrio sp.]
MKKLYAVLGIVAGALAVLGGVFVAVGAAMGAKNDISLFRGFVNFSWGRGELVRSGYTKLDEFDSLYIDMDYGSVEIVRGDEYAVEYELYSDDLICEVENGRLTFKERRKNFLINIAWFDKKAGRLKLYVPDKKLDSAEIYTDMGSVNVSGLSCGRLTLECDMGSVECTDVSTDRLYIDADMGDVAYTGTVTDRIEADIDMGSVGFEGWLDCDFDVSADMGSVDIVTYYSVASYRYDLDVDMGKKEIRDNGGTDSEKVHIMEIECDMGDISITHKSAE